MNEERDAILSSFPSALSDTLDRMAKANHRLHGLKGICLEVDDLKHQWIDRSRATMVQDSWTLDVAYSTTNRSVRRDRLGDRDIASCLRPCDYADIF